MKKLLSIFVLIGLLVFAGCQKHTEALETGVAGADETSAIGALRAILIAERTYAGNSSRPIHLVTFRWKEWSKRLALIQTHPVSPAGMKNIRRELPAKPKRCGNVTTKP